MVTAEVALALPSLFLVAMLATWLVLAGVTELRCADSAEVVAKALAAGDSPTQVYALIEREAPGALVQVVSDALTVRVTVRLAVPRPNGLAAFLPNVTTTASAVAVLDR